MNKEDLVNMVNSAYTELGAALRGLRNIELVLVEERFQLANDTAKAHHEGLIDGKNQQQRDAAERVMMADRLNKIAALEIAVASAKLEVELATNERRRVDALLTIAQLQQS